MYLDRVQIGAKTWTLESYESREHLSMTIRITLITCTLAMLACSDPVLLGSERPVMESAQVQPPKSDSPYATAIEWASTFYLTQIYDDRWNPAGSSSDMESNNCGPASLAMVMGQRNLRPSELSSSEAIDHARALMYAAYPHIDADILSLDAVHYVIDNYVCINDNQQSVYFDRDDTAPSIAQAIQNTGQAPVFGYSWSDIRNMLAQSESLIAHGHITDDWRNRFPGEYGQYAQGGVPHFIAVFATSSPDRFLICDPMHLGGPVIMTQNEFQTFFKSPINVFDTSIRVIGYPDSSTYNTVIQDERSILGGYLHRVCLYACTCSVLGVSAFLNS